MVGTSLAIQRLRLCSPNAGGTGLIPDWETEIPHAARHGKKKKNVYGKNTPNTGVLKLFGLKIIDFKF